MYNSVTPTSWIVFYCRIYDRNRVGLCDCKCHHLPMWGSTCTPVPTSPHNPKCVTVWTVWACARKTSCLYVCCTVFPILGSIFIKQSHTPFVARGKFMDSSVCFILWGEWISTHNYTTIHLKVVEIFQSEPTDTVTVVKHGVILELLVFLFLVFLNQTSYYMVVWAEKQH